MLEHLILVTQRCQVLKHLTPLFIWYKDASWIGAIYKCHEENNRNGYDFCNTYFA